jgi:hypothetical protein
MTDALLLVEALGWAATAIFIGSYFFSRPETLVRVQMTGAVAWVIYGALVGAKPVVAANVLVFVAAAWKTLRPRRRPAETACAPVPHRAPAGVRLTPEITP